MTRFRYVMATTAATLGIAITGFVPTAPRLVWNASASVPIGFYTVTPTQRIEVPDENGSAKVSHGSGVIISLRAA